MAEPFIPTWPSVENARRFFAEHAEEFRREAQAARDKTAATGESGDEIEIDTEDLDEDDDEIFGITKPG
ncbi:MAG: hypothetical protein ACKV2Q_28070 [Planctomycetaceae bacterium]